MYVRNNLVTYLRDGRVSDQNNDQLNIVYFQVFIIFSTVSREGLFLR